MSFKARKVTRTLAKHGFYVLREGGNHTIVRRDSDGVQIAIPRHGDINRYTAKGIASDAKIDWNAFKREVS